MKERPILFSGPMVRAILEGRKTQTRRVVKAGFSGIHKMPYVPGMIYSPTHGLNAFFRDDKEGMALGVRCPYGQTGDRLWVRETWRPDDHDFGNPWPWQWIIQFRADDRVWHVNPPKSERELWAKRFGTANTTGGCDPKWRPSIFMPKWASRITLEVTGVRVERLQDIGDDDAKAEGLNRIPHGREGTFFHHLNTEPSPENFCYPDDAYRALWESINGPGSWDANPWVWVIEFKRITP